MRNLKIISQPDEFAAGTKLVVKIFQEISKNASSGFLSCVGTRKRCSTLEFVEWSLTRVNQAFFCLNFCKLNFQYFRLSKWPKSSFRFQLNACFCRMFGKQNNWFKFFNNFQLECNWFSNFTTVKHHKVTHNSQLIVKPQNTGTMAPWSRQWKTNLSSFQSHVLSSFFPSWLLQFRKFIFYLSSFLGVAAIKKQEEKEFSALCQQLLSNSKLIIAPQTF